MAGLAKQVGGRAVSYLSVRRGRPPASYGSGHGTTKGSAYQGLNEDREWQIVHRFEFPQRTPHHLGRDASRPSQDEELLRTPIRERLDHAVL